MKKLCPVFFLLSFLLAVQMPTIAYPQTKTEKSKKTAKSTSSGHSKKTAKKSTKKSSNKAAQKQAPPTDVIPPAPPAPAGPTMEQQVTAYKYAYALYAAKQFDKAKEIFKKLAMVSKHPAISANSLYYYSQCAFRTEDYIGCVKGLNVLAKKWPNCAAIKNGYVSKFCLHLIDQCSDLTTSWDYFRFKERTDETGKVIWKESIPPGYKIKRINFKLAFGLHRVLKTIQPNAASTADAKAKLERMLSAPITIVWVDEKAAPHPWGHPGDFFSVFSLNEKKDFSKFICERMFFNWETEYFYKFLNMHDDVRNLKPRYVATTRTLEQVKGESMADLMPVSLETGGPVTTSTVLTPPAEPTVPLTLAKLFQVSGYFPWSDSYTNTIEASPLELSL